MPIGTLRLENYTQTAGNTRLSGGSIGATTPLSFQGGLLSGTGLITGDVSNSGGVVTPGFSPGTINIQAGTYTQGVAGAYAVELGGLTPGTQFDQVNVTGRASLNGTLNASLINGFVPILGNSFVILNHGSRGGSFSTTKFAAS